MEKKGKKKIERRVFTEGCNTVEYGLYTGNKKSIEKMLSYRFRCMNQYKNGFIMYVWNTFDTLAKEDKKLEDALKTIKEQNKQYGNAIYKSERAEAVKEAYAYLRNFVYGQKKINLGDLKKEYMKSASIKYKIYLSDDSRDYALDNTLMGFKELIKNNGKNVVPKANKDLTALQYKAMYGISKKTGEVGEENNTGLEIIEKDGNYYVRIWDTRADKIKNILDVADFENNKFNTSSGRCPKHLNTVDLKIHLNKNNRLQVQMLNEAYKGGTKIKRLYKKGKWVYRLQVTYAVKSPVIADITLQDYVLAINTQTETVAYCRSDGLQGIVEFTPSTPRVIGEIQELSQYVDRSRRAMNSDLYNKDGTIKMTKEEMVEQGIEWKKSRKYSKSIDKIRELYRVNTANRNMNNLTLAKTLIQLGNNIILDNNSFHSWGTKICRTAEATQERVAKTARKNDYTRQIHDRAPRKI